jgi:hypothetical protein
MDGTQMKLVEEEITYDRRFPLFVMIDEVNDERSFSSTSDLFNMESTDFAIPPTFSRMVIIVWQL